MIYLASDQKGFKAIQFAMDFLSSQEIEFKNIGVQNENENLKLIEFIPKVAAEVLRDKNNRAIIACGSGTGVEIGANRFAGIRASLVSDVESAEWGRTYDDCNVLCLAGWKAEKEKVEKIIDTWLKTKFGESDYSSTMIKTFDSWH